MKYRPDFPERFGSLEDARSHCVDFFDWYNHEHHHSGLEMLTPADVHYGLADLRVAEKQKVLDEAYRTHPERFPGGPPKARKLKREVWINKPKPAAAPDEEGAPDDTEPSLHEEHDQSAQNQKSAAETPTMAVSKSLTRSAPSIRVLLCVSFAVKVCVSQMHR